jgi:ABC-type nickel/cobalt efflux system permease component RcnA
MSVRTRLSVLAAALALPVVAFALVGAADPPAAGAHPLGNFTVNQYSRIELYADVVRVRYVLDMAEIPAFQEIERVDTDGDGEQSPDEGKRYLAGEAPEVIDNLALVIDGRERELTNLRADVAYPEGQGGLQTLRVALLLEADAAGAASLEFSDGNYEDRLGWKEVVVQPGPGVVVAESSASTADVSRELTTYPDGLLSDPLDVTSAVVKFDARNGAPAPAIESVPAGPASKSAAEKAGGGFAGLIDSENLTVTVILLSLLAALGFGAVHALEPGHGKTFVAAYFVGVKGTAREALLLGLIVAVTHTIGVFAIGLLTLFGSQFILPENLYPWLSLASGVMVLVLGVRLLMLRYRGVGFIRRFVRGASLSQHAAHDHDHQHDHRHAHEVPPGSPWKGLIALGLADGLTPSPSALVVLLAAVSLDRIGLGILLIVAFSVGLAAVLALVSLALVYARRVVDWLSARRSGLRSHSLLGRASGVSAAGSIIARALPVGAAVLLIGVGATLTVRALSASQFSGIISLLGRVS